MMVHKLLDEFCGTPFWDSELTWNSTNPDITPCFQATVLTWVPCAFLWLFAPLECYFQKKSQSKPLPWTALNITRIMVALALSVLWATNILDLLFNYRAKDMFTALIIAASLKALTFVFAVILMLFNKKRGRHTSGILFIFWVSLTICEIFSYRSAFLQIRNEVQAPNEISFVIQMVYFPLLIAELLLSCIADIRYRHIPAAAKKDSKKECPELSASFLSTLLFWWFNDMSILGWKRPLTFKDLWDLNPSNRTDHVSELFEKHYRHTQWMPSVSSPRLNRDGSIPFAQDSNEKMKVEEEAEFIVRNGYVDQSKKKISITRALCKTFWAYFLAGSIYKLFYDGLQFVSPILLKLLIAYVTSSDPLWIGILYAVCMFLTGTLQSLLLGNYFHRMFILGMRIRTALVAAIYKKSLILSSSAKKESTIGEIVNLMSVDSQRFMDLMPYLNMVWSAPLQIIVSLALLWNVLGPSALAGLLVMVVLMPLNAFIASEVKKKQVKQMKFKDERVKLVNEVLSGIKVLKLYAWEEAFRKKVNVFRERELRHLRKIAYLNAVSAMTWNCSPFLVALASFACYVLVDENNVLDASTAFVSLSLFNILRFPLTMLPNLITYIIMTNVSVKRINKYMNSEELEKYVLHDSSLAHSIAVRNGYFSWSKPRNEEQKKNPKPTLKNINLTVEKGSLIAIVGKVGSGKSSLLSAILGDMEKISGSVSINGRTAYVSQQPWIQNSTLQNNILFSKPLDKEEYKNVIDACGLTPDLSILPGGDQTEIGEKVITILSCFSDYKMHFCLEI
ncbi:multidrug resistance-associated protein 1-like [Stegodyphus dumicola]|uniref:multidrug resistance-associated protein 1-like n=1 Tax=Stegodyphus dumicola TaxID=202533 RepID=UPI0015AB3C47|nr:multidrug resistance-associated protein 1-like [Stegodyphus dumicola]